LGIQESNLYGSSIESSDTAAGVHPFFGEDTLGIVGSQICVDTLEHLSVLPLGIDPFGDDATSHSGHLGAIFSIRDESMIQGLCALALYEGATCGKSREQGEHESARRMNPCELVVVREREVDVCALQVRPTMSSTIEDAVERLIDHVVLMRPKARLAEGVHPGMHSPGQEGAPEGREQVPDLVHLLAEDSTGGHEIRDGTSRLDLDDVEGEFVGPRGFASLNVHVLRAPDQIQQLVRHRANVEGRSIDDHVFDLDPVAREGRIAGFVAHRARPFLSSCS
jgi:hypothetical protein